MTETKYLIGVIINNEFYSGEINKLTKGHNPYKDSMIVGFERRRIDFTEYEGKAIAIRVDKKDDYALSVTDLGDEIKEGLLKLDIEVQ